MKLANKQLSKLVHEEARKFETEILCLKGKKREEAMNAYRRLLSSLPDQLVYFTRSQYGGPKSLKDILKEGKLGLVYVWDSIQNASTNYS
jgi:hypothetical protein